MSFIKFWTGAAWKLINTANVFRVWTGAAWKDVTFLRVYELYNGQVGWREVWAPAPPAAPPVPVDPPVVPPPVPLTVEVNFPIIFGKSYVYGVVNSSRTVTATVTGGIGLLEYSWQRVSWSSERSPNINIPNAATTGFSQEIQIGDGDEQTAAFRIVVQDSLGNTGSADVSARFLVIIG